MTVGRSLHRRVTVKSDHDVIVVGFGFGGIVAAEDSPAVHPGARYPPYSEHTRERAVESWIS